MGDNPQLSAQRRDKATQRADVHVGLVLQLGDGRLVHLEHVRQFLRRQVQSLPQLLQSHLRMHLRRALADSLPALRRHLFYEILR